MSVPAKIGLKMLQVLADGKRHTKKELHECLWDELASDRAIYYHLSMLRKQLRLRGEEIVCEFYYRKFYFRHIKLLDGTSSVSDDSPTSLTRNPM